MQIENDRVRVFVAVYGGKAMAVVELMKSPGVVWLRSRSFAAGDLSTDASEVVTVALDTTSAAASHFPRLIERKSEKLGEVRLEDAEVIVSGGRGLGGPEPFEQLKEVASLIDAQVAASRAACDAGWVPPSYQVGQTGRKVKRQRCTSPSQFQVRASTLPVSPMRRSSQRSTPTRMHRSLSTVLSELLRITAKYYRFSSSSSPQGANES